MKGRYLITQKQIEKIKKNSTDGDFIKILRIMREVEHRQFIGDSKKSVKENLKSLRMTV